MNTKLLSLFAAAAVIGLAGCNKAESPAEVQHDVANAQQEANKDVADAQTDRADALQDSSKEVQIAAEIGIALTALFALDLEDAPG